MKSIVCVKNWNVFFFCGVRLFASDRKVFLLSEEKVRSYVRENELLHRQLSENDRRTKSLLVPLMVRFVNFRFVDGSQTEFVCFIVRQTLT